jgi:DNA-binding XRE family transcriptional regulator
MSKEQRYKFTDIINYLLKDRGLTRNELANKISISRQSLYKIENGSANPSLDSIKKLIMYIVNDGREHNILKNQELAIKTLESLFDLKLLDGQLKINSATIEQEEERQEEIPDGSEIWIISDKILELDVPDFANITAANIERGIRLSYFLPFSEHNLPYRLATILEEHVSNKDLLTQRVEIYQISDIAFSSRIRIINPLANDPIGAYSLTGPGKKNFLYYDIPIDILRQLIKTIGSLKNDVDRKSTSYTQDKPFTIIRTGEIIKLSLFTNK